MPNAEIELTKDLVEALESLLESGLTTVEPAAVLAGYLDALAKSFGLSESLKISEDPLERVDPPSLALDTIRHYLASGEELSNDGVRTKLYTVFVELSSDARVRRELNRNNPLSDQGLLYVAQIYWNLEGSDERPSLPIRPRKSAAGGERIEADIPASDSNKDYAVMPWTPRVNEKGACRSSGQSFRKQGARLAVLAAKHLTAARAEPSPSLGTVSFRLDDGTRKPKAITWAIEGGSTSDRRPSTTITGISATESLITSKARARFAIDSLERDLRDAIERFVPDELPPKEIFGTLHDRLLARQASADALDAEAMTAYLYPQESRDVLLRHVDALPPDLVESLQSTVPAFDAFIPVRNRVVRGRPLQPDDFSNVEACVERFRSPQFPKTTATLEQLATDSGWQPTSRAGSEPWDLVLHNLPEADFDETGLLGREQQINDIVARVKRRREPTTLIGEGGIGKTALALEVCYRLVDDPEPVFDAVLWTSLKTEHLTTAGVRELANALRDIEGVTEALGQAIDHTFDGDVAELTDLIDERSMLVVIDNLETVQGHEFVRLYDALPSVTFLLTSRVGLGQLERPVAVGPLDLTSAEELFRRFARSSGGSSLADQPPEEVAKVLQALRYSPLAIRWYILSVEAGMSPTDTLRNQDELLRFCVGNVVDALGNDEVHLLQVLRALDRPLAFDELAVIADIEVDTLRRGAQRLTQRSLLVWTQTPGNESLERLALSSTARSFLPPVSHSPAVEEVYRRERAYNQERESERQRLSDHGRYFDPNIVWERSQDDGPVVHLLRRALRKSKSGDPDAAAATVASARSLNAGYFEVDRLDAFFASIGGSPERATVLYREALNKCESEEERCWVGYFYSAHLARAVHDVSAAISLAETTHNCFKTYETAHHLGNFYFWNEQFEQGEQLIALALEQAPTAEFKRKATTSLVRCLQQRSDADLVSSAVAEALARALRAVDIGLELHDSGSTDDKLVLAVNGALVSALKAARIVPELSPEDERALAHAVARMNDDMGLRRERSWGFVEFAVSSLPAEMRKRVAAGVTVEHIAFLPGERLRGNIVNVRQKYGFIAHPRFPENVFFQAGWLQPPLVMDELSKGSAVDFTPSKNYKGQDQALDVTLARQDAEGVPLGDTARDSGSATPAVDQDVRDH